MELFSPVLFSDGRRVQMRLVTDRIGIKASKLFDWFNDKSRQLRSIASDETLKRALISAEKAPAEGARLAIGERINVYRHDGSRQRLRICGVRSGGFSNAYTVIDLDEMKPYCLKESRATPGDERKKNRDLSAEAELSILIGPHRQFITTHSAFYHRSRLYLLTEYLPDESLDLKLKRVRISTADAVNYAIQICQAMEHARKVLPGFVHGDIKPANCMLTPDGGLKLGDLGLASADGSFKAGVREAGFPADGNSSTGTRAWGGTAAYMAPEMSDRERPDRTNADIYALGVTLFEMLCGSRPFAHSTRSGLLEMHRHAEPDFGRLASEGVPESLASLVRSCMAKSPADRPQGFSEVKEALLRIVEGVSPPRMSDPAKRIVDDQGSPRLAMSLMAIGRFDAALAMIDNDLLQNGRSAELLAVKAMVQASAGRVESAYESSTAALMMRADLFVVLLAHGRVLIARGGLEDAAGYLRRAHSMDPRNCTVLNLLGKVCAESGEHEEAELLLNRSLAIDAAQPEALNGLAQIEMAKGNNDSAVAHARKALAIDPNQPDSNVLLADALVRSGRGVEAVKAFKDALRNNPSSRELRKKFVIACLSLSGLAEERFDLHLVRLLIHSARLLQTDEASRRTADKFVNRFVGSLERAGRGNAELFFFSDATLAKLADGPGISRSDELLARLTSARSNTPESAAEMQFHLHHSLGRVLYHLDDLDECEAVFSGMLESFGPNESSYYYLGACAEIRENFPQALEYYRKADQLLKCEDTRTGIQRVAYELKTSVRMQQVH